MRSILLCLFFFCCSLTALAQPPPPQDPNQNRRITKKDRISGLLDCLPPAPAETLAERKVAYDLRTIAENWGSTFPRRRDGWFFTLDHIIEDINELHKPQPPFDPSRLLNGAWDEWVQMMADVIFSFWCVDSKKGYDTRCLHNVMSFFGGRQPYLVERQFLQSLEYRAKAGKAIADRRIEQLERELERQRNRSWNLRCSVEGLRDLAKRLPTRRPADVSVDQNQRPEMENDRSSDGGSNSFPSVLSPSGMIEGLQRSVGKALNNNAFPRGDIRSPALTGGFGKPRMVLPL